MDKPKSNWIKDEDQKGNFSNNQKDAFDLKKRYIGVRLQQGVPLLDRDWNELEDIRRYEEQTLRKYYIGDGTPDDGFKISALEPPVNDFLVGKGRCMVEGFDVVNDSGLYDFSVNKYTEQKTIDKTIPDLIPYKDQSPGSPAFRDDIVYLDVWIKEVRSKTAPGETDPEKIDESLGNTEDVNIETSVRHRLVWRVRVAQGTEEYKNPPSNHHYYVIAKIIRNKTKEIIEKGDIHDLRKVFKGLAQENWINVDLTGSGWTNYNETKYNSVSYFRDTHGIVHLRGSVRRIDSSKKVIFTLDEGYRPAKNEIQVIAGYKDENSSSFLLFQISNNGEVLYLAGPVDPTSGVFLDGITFGAELK